MKKELSQLQFFFTVFTAVTSALAGAYSLYDKALENTQQVKNELIDRLNYIESVKLDNLQDDVSRLNDNVVQIMTKMDLKPIKRDLFGVNDRVGRGFDRP